jgi:hypothetical protein
MKTTSFYSFERAWSVDTPGNRMMGYFGRDALPMPIGIGATTRIVDALDGLAGS